jgi:hypothetical protein
MIVKAVLDSILVSIGVSIYEYFYSRRRILSEIAFIGLEFVSPPILLIDFVGNGDLKYAI